MTCNFKYEIKEFLRHELISETQIMDVTLQRNISMFNSKKRIASNESNNISKFWGFRGFRRNILHSLFIMDGWLVGCFGLNSPLRQYLCISGCFPENGRKKREMTGPNNPIHIYCKHNRFCPTIIQISRTPQHGNLPGTIALPDHPLFCNESK